MVYPLFSGRQSVSGLRLFQVGSEFSLFYKDRDDNWRTVGDVPWRYMHAHYLSLKFWNLHFPFFFIYLFICFLRSFILVIWEVGLWGHVIH